MTRILACSDIHNNVGAVRQLRSREANDYDAIIVAGDIGSLAAHEIFDVLVTFKCPVLFVFGNWDHRLSYREDFGLSCHHLHLSPYRLGALSIVGESIDGIDPTWEAIRAELAAEAPEALSARRDDYAARQRARLSEIVANEGLERTIIVTHYRLTKTRYDMPRAPLFLFGHIHRFQDTTFVGSRFVNVSALDVKVTVVPSYLNVFSSSDYRNINDGGYVIITRGKNQLMSIESRRFNPDFSGWRRIDDGVYWQAPPVDA